MNINNCVEIAVTLICAIFTIYVKCGIIIMLDILLL